MEFVDKDNSSNNSVTSEESEQLNFLKEVPRAQKERDAEIAASPSSSHHNYASDDSDSSNTSGKSSSEKVQSEEASVENKKSEEKVKPIHYDPYDNSSTSDDSSDDESRSSNESSKLKAKKADSSNRCEKNHDADEHFEKPARLELTKTIDSSSFVEDKESSVNSSSSPSQILSDEKKNDAKIMKNEEKHPEQKPKQEKIVLFEDSPSGSDDEHVNHDVNTSNIVSQSKAGKTDSTKFFEENEEDEEFQKPFKSKVKTIIKSLKIPEQEDNSHIISKNSSSEKKKVVKEITLKEKAVKRTLAKKKDVKNMPVKKKVVSQKNTTNRQTSRANDEAIPRTRAKRKRQLPARFDKSEWVTDGPKMKKRR